MRQISNQNYVSVPVIKLDQQKQKKWLEKNLEVYQEKEKTFLIKGIFLYIYNERLF